MTFILEMADGLVVNFSRGFKMKNYSHFEKLLIVLANLILIGSVLLALSFAFNFHGFRDSFQNWYEIGFFFFWVIYAPFVPQACYELYQIIKKSLVETHELNQEVSISEEEVYLFDGSKITYYPKKLFRFLSPRKLFRLLKGDF